MRILSWVHEKINGRQDKKRFKAASARNHGVQGIGKEEFSDWPQGLLAIGTFGNNEFKRETDKRGDIENPHPLMQDLPEFTLDEVKKLEKELIKLLTLKPNSRSPESETARGCKSNPVKKLYSALSLEAEQSIFLKFCDELENGEADDLSPSAKIILGKAKDLLADSQNKTIRRKSISFLLKKMFVCRSGFAPAPSLRDPISESKIEKILKAILHKKIYPQNSASTTAKYLENRQIDKAKIRDKKLMMTRDKTEEKAEDKCKWVKTDSEYIVLEI